MVQTFVKRPNMETMKNMNRRQQKCVQQTLAQFQNFESSQVQLSSKTPKWDQEKVQKEQGSYVRDIWRYPFVQLGILTEDYQEGAKNFQKTVEDTDNVPVNAAIHLAEGDGLGEIIQDDPFQGWYQATAQEVQSETDAARNLGIKFGTDPTGLMKWWERHTSQVHFQFETEASRGQLDTLKKNVKEERLIVKTKDTSNQQNGSELLIITPKSGKYETTIVFFHGFRETAERLERLQIKWVNHFKNVRIVLPNQPKGNILREASVGNLILPGNLPLWYKVRQDTFQSYRFDENTRRVQKGLDKNVEDYYSQVVEPVLEKNKKVVFQGFSQGCAMAFKTQMKCAKVSGVQPAGVCLFSGIPFGQEQLFRTPKDLGRELTSAEKEVKEKVQKMPILQGHGMEDIVIPIRAQRKFQKGLKNDYKMKNHKFAEYDEGHDINKKELDFTESWLMSEVGLEKQHSLAKALRSKNSLSRLSNFQRFKGDKYSDSQLVREMQDFTY